MKRSIYGALRIKELLKPCQKIAVEYPYDLIEVIRVYDLMDRVTDDPEETTRRVLTEALQRSILPVALASSMLEFKDGGEERKWIRGFKGGSG